MTNDDALVLDWLNEIVEIPDDWEMFYSTSEMAILAKHALEMLEKKAPVKPILRGDGWYCPCRTLLGAGGTQKETRNTAEYALFCRKCGREMDWSDVND